MSSEQDEVLQSWVNDFVDMYDRPPTLDTMQEWEIRINMLYEDMWEDDE